MKINYKLMWGTRYLLAWSHVLLIFITLCFLLITTEVKSQYSGIGVVDPTTALDVNGTGLFRNGNAAAANGNDQLRFGFNGLNQNMHGVKTRHTSAAGLGNAIDFYLWDAGVDASDAVGSEHVMTLEAFDGGRVGIGTASPNSMLDVSGRTITQNFTMTAGAAAGRILQTDAVGNASWVIPSSVFSTTNTDNQSIRNLTFSGTTLTVGIERGSSQTVSLAALSDNQSIRNLGLSGTTLTVGIEDGSSQTVSLAPLRDNLGNHRLTQNLQTRGRWISTFGGSEGLFVESGGNVGIGINNPTADLHVAGNALISNMTTRTSDAFIVTSDAIGNLRRVSWANASSAFADNLGNHRLAQNLETRNQWLSNDGDAEGLMIAASNGYVGVNLSPSAPMTIRANGNNNAFQNGLYVYNPDNAGDDGDAMIAARTQGTNGGDPVLALGILGGQSWSIGVDNSDSDKLKFSNSFNNVASAVGMTLTNQRRLGIGTTDPESTLHINGNNATMVFGRSGSILMEITRSNIGNGSSAYSYMGTAVTRGNAASFGYFNRGNNNPDSRLELGFRGDERLMVIERNGSVGIGTIIPSRKLEVSQIGNGNPFVAATSPNLIKITSTGNNSSSGIILEARNGGGTRQSYAIGVNPDFSGGLLTMTNETGQDFFGYVRSTGNVYTNVISGNLGVGTRTPTRKLHVIGDIFATGTIASSDSTLKANIKEYAIDAISQVRQLNPVTYNWKKSAQAAGGYTDRSQIGFLAQEVKEIIPEAVSGEEGNGMGIDYTKITPVVVKAMQQQQTIIDAQQAQLDELKTELKEIKELLNK